MKKVVYLNSFQAITTGTLDLQRWNRAHALFKTMLGINVAQKVQVIKQPDV
jgi:hypothetical protein